MFIGIAGTIPNLPNLPGQGGGGGVEVLLEYDSSSFCKVTNPNLISPTVAEPAGGTFSYTGTGTLGIVPNTGLINVFESDSGSYTITYSVGGSSSSFPIAIGNEIILSITTSPGATICTGDTATLTANASGGSGGFTYSWDTSPVQTIQSIDVTTSGNYTVTVTDSDGCSVSAVQQITASTNATAIASINNDAAMSFNGTDSYIDAGTGLGNSLGNSYSGDLSISIWFKATSIGTAPGLFSINNGNGLFGPIQIYFFNNRLYFRVQPTQSGFNYISIPFTDTTSWHHLTVVYKSGSQSNSKMYLDGADTSTNSGGSFPTTLDFDGIKTLIGYYYSDSFLFNGSISNVSVWNAGLTSSQVTEIYNEGVPSNLNNHSAYSNLVSWWQLGSNTSWVDPYWIALDEKGTNNGQSQNVAAPNNMGENAIVDGVGSYANGLSDGMGGDEVIGDAPYSSSNSLSVNMDVEDRTTDTPS